MIAFLSVVSDVLLSNFMCQHTGHRKKIIPFQMLSLAQRKKLRMLLYKDGKFILEYKRFGIFVCFIEEAFT